MLFNQFPREVGPPRKVVFNKEDGLKFINYYNGVKTAVYQSIYSFKEIFENGKPNYNTAIINKLYFDFDDKSCSSWEECNKLHKKLEEDNIKHFIVMSGRGYHLYIFTPPTCAQNPKGCIYNSQHYFIGQLNLLVDKQVIGNPAQLARVPNTYNQRGKRYCIPLNKKEFEMGDEYIKNLASKQHFISDIFIGEKLFDISKFDSEKPNDINFSVNDFKFTDSSVKIDHCPNCIKYLLQKGELGWKERYTIIVYFRDMGYSRKEVMEILKKYLSKQKFKHCIVDERQLQYLFDRFDLSFPTCDKLKLDGICVGKCEQYNDVIYK